MRSSSFRESYEEVILFLADTFTGVPYAFHFAFVHAPPPVDVPFILDGSFLLDAVEFFITEQ